MAPMEELKITIKMFFENNSCDLPLITFYGGEPLLRPQFILVCINFIEKELGKKVEKRIITNGMLITDELAKKLSDYGFQVAISIDGMEKFHDLKRVDIAKKGSFRKVISGYKKLIENNIQTNILMMVGDHNLDNLEENVAYLCDLKPDAIALNLPRDLHTGELKGINRKMLLKKYENCLNILYEKKIPELNFLKLIKGFYDDTFPINFCSACGSQSSLSPYNYIGPCQAYLNNKKYFSDAKSLDKNDVLKNKDFKYWGEINKLTSKKCSKCSILPLCMDDCLMDRDNNGDITQPKKMQCLFRHKMIELLIERIASKKRLIFRT